MTEDQKERLAELKAMDQEALTEDEKVELAELVALETPAEGEAPAEGADTVEETA